MGATSHKRWGNARVLDVCEAAQHVRKVVLEPDQVDGLLPGSRNYALKQVAAAE